MSRNQSQNHYFSLLSKILLQEKISKCVYSFLDEKSILLIKKCLRKCNSKQYKAQIKELVGSYIIDFGKSNEKVKYLFSSEEGTLKIKTNIFNIKSDYLSKFTHIIHQDKQIELEPQDLFEYLRLLPKNEVFLSDNKEKESKAKISKFFIHSNYFDKTILHDKKNEIIENSSHFKTFNNDDKEYYPLKLIQNINYWCIILCSGGLFSFGLYYKDKEICHKSDHKYVVRKKAGKRQIAKDKSKNVNSIGAQIRRANEQKHQENIEMILKDNEDELNKCDCIFIQAPGINKNILIGENKLLEKYKHKLFNLSLNLPKANYSNICLAYKMLTSSYFQICDDNVKKILDS